MKNSLTKMIFPYTYSTTYSLYDQNTILLFVPHQGLSFFTGHTDGSLIMFTLEQVDTSKNRFQHGGYTVDSSANTCIRRKEHTASIVAVDSCPILGIVATCRYQDCVSVYNVNLSAFLASKVVKEQGELFYRYAYCPFVKCKLAQLSQ